MASEDHNDEKQQKIRELEKEVADLRQGLCIVQDYYHDLEETGREQDAEENVGRTFLKPLITEDSEFEGIWKFHDEMVIHDPATNVPCVKMYESFVSYCREKGRVAADRSSFEFMLARMGMRLEGQHGLWQGCRIR